MSKTITVRVDDDTLAIVDQAVEAGVYASRSEAFRAGAVQVARDAWERKLVEAFAAGYAAHPDEPDEWGRRAAALRADD